MKVEITSQALEYIKSKKLGAITVVFPGCGKCNSPQRQASIGLVTPADTKRFELVVSDGINVYVRDDVRKHKDSIVVSLKKGFMSKTLVAD